MKRKKNFISIGCVLWSVAVLAIVMLLVYFSNLEVIFQMTIVDGVNLVVILRL